MHRHLTTLLATIAFAVSVAGTKAEAQSTDSLRTVLTEAASRRWTLRLTMPLDTATGRVSLAAADTVLIEDRRIHLGSVFEASRRDTDEMSVIGGMVVGGVILGVLGYSIVPCGGDYGSCGGAYIRGGMGVALGSMIGALVGESTGPKRWEVLWTRQ